MLRGGVQALEKGVSHHKIDNSLPSLLRNLQKVQREENGFTLAFFKHLRKGKEGHARGFLFNSYCWFVGHFGNFPSPKQCGRVGGTLG